MHVAVAVEHEIDAIIFQHRYEVLADLDQIAFGVRIVRAVRVGRVMEEDDDPLRGAGREIVFHPLEHGSVSGISTGLRVEADQVDRPGVRAGRPRRGQQQGVGRAERPGGAEPDLGTRQPGRMRGRRRDERMPQRPGQAVRFRPVAHRARQRVQPAERARVQFHGGVVPLGRRRPLPGGAGWLDGPVQHPADLAVHQPGAIGQPHLGTYLTAGEPVREVPRVRQRLGGHDGAVSAGLPHPVREPQRAFVVKPADHEQHHV